MERSALGDIVRIVRGVIFIQILFTSACVGSSPCMPESDPSGRYTISGGSSNIWSHGTPSGLAVHVSVSCDPGASPQSSVTSQCLDGTWRPAWPRCVRSSPCMPDSDPLGRYTISGGSSNIWSHGTPSGSAVHVSLNCDPGATAQSSVTSQCLDGTWRPAWPRCEKPCSVPTNRGEVRQFVNGSTSKPVTLYISNRPTVLPDGTELVARCRDPGKHRLLGDQRRTCLRGQWTGREPQCESVDIKVLFYGAPRHVASNGTVVVPVYSQSPKLLYVHCKANTWTMVTYPHLSTPAECTNLRVWSQSWKLYRIRLYPITTKCSGIFTCSSLSSSHSVHVIFKAAECEVTSELEHGRLFVIFQQRWRRLHPGDIVQHDTRLYFYCDEDYDLIGPSSITCDRGEWSHDPPVCKVSRCPELIIPDNAIMVGVYSGDRRINDEREFHCRNGYILRGDTNNLRCMEGGEWSAPLPTCEAVAHRVSPCEGVRCALWERCVVTGPDSTVCGCIHPSSCTTSGPTVCGTDGVFHISECHLRAHACLEDIEVDIAEDFTACIDGVPEEERRPTQQATIDEIPPLLSSSSSFEIYEPVAPVDNQPSDPTIPPSAEEDTDPQDSYSFRSSESWLSSYESMRKETSHSTPPPSTLTPSTPKLTPSTPNTSGSGSEEGGTVMTSSTPVNSSRSTPEISSENNGAGKTQLTSSNSTMSDIESSAPKALA